MQRYRRLWGLLIFINIAGAAYGYYWYAGQLARTPLYLWPVTPDCPLFASLFALVIYLRLKGREAGLLSTITCLGLIKYGIWTVVVLSAFWLQTGNLMLEGILLIISHVGMFLEGILMLFIVNWRARWVFGTTLFFVVWDWFDYVVGTYPYLPAANLLPLARGLAVALTLLVTIVAGWLAITHSRKNRYAGTVLPYYRLRK